MIVYHGTTKERAKRILYERRIKVTDNENKRYKDTTLGFVYVTAQLCDAMDFSSRPEKGEKNCRFIVFKISISEDELNPDMDEKNGRLFYLKEDIRNVIGSSVI